MWRYIARLVETGAGRTQAHMLTARPARGGLASKQAARETISCLLAWWVIKSRKVPTFLGGRGDSQSFDCGLGVASPSVDTPAVPVVSVSRRCLCGSGCVDSGVLPRGQLNVNVNVTVGSKRRPVGLITEIQIGQRMGQNARHQRIRSRAARQQTSAVV